MRFRVRPALALGLSLVLAAAALGCLRAQGQASDTASRLRAWPDRFAPAACWLALSENPEALHAAWPEVERWFPYLRGREGVDPVWVATEMSSLSPEHGREAWSGICELILASAAPQREEITAALLGAESWMTHWEEVGARTAELDTAGEMLLAAAFAQPQTRDVFQSILENRGWDPERADPEEVGATLTSAEHLALSLAVARRVAGMSPSERNAWFEAVAQWLAQRGLGALPVDAKPCGP